MITDKGEGGVKNLKKLVTSFMDSPSVHKRDSEQQLSLKELATHLIKVVITHKYYNFTIVLIQKYFSGYYNFFSTYVALYFSKKIFIMIFLREF